MKQIAIVDDNMMFRKGLAALIGLFPGCELLFDAREGEDCIRQLKADMIPDILLMDIAMPGMDGYTATAWVRDHLPAVRVLALSTMDTEGSIIRMIRSGARGYLLKDADPAELKKAFDEVMSLGYYYNDVVSRKIMQTANLMADDSREIQTMARLSDRELTFLRLACSEKTYFEIAQEMHVSDRTVDGYRDALFKKLNVASRVGLVIYAVKNGIVRF
ncbi:MAG TPA: response regulator transcription factor [Puia sp.]|jgi:DNA-binding NarL/FixJ family response regulator|nr:response regulator transcription factor [Puia sp.]